MASHKHSVTKGRNHRIPRLDLSLESTLGNVEVAEREMTQFSKRAGYNETQCGEIGLAVRETVANAIIHGNCCDPNKKVALEAELRTTGLVVCIRDEGCGFDPASLPDPRDPCNLLRESGRGVFLLHVLMDEVTLRRPEAAGMEVTMVKYLPGNSSRRKAK